MRAAAFLIALIASNFICHAQETATSASAKSDASKPANKWESAIQAFEEQDAKNSPALDGTVFVGSSSIRLWKLEDSFPQRGFLNRGFGGSQLADSVFFADRIVIKYRPKTVVMYAGDNDIAGGKSPEVVAEDFKKFVAAVHSKLPNTRIHFIAIKPSIARWKLVDKVRTANQLIRDFVIQTPNVCYIDVFHPMLDADGKPRSELYVKDGLHMTADGYRIWTQELEPFVR